MIQSVKPFASFYNASVVQEVLSVLQEYPVFYDCELAGFMKPDNGF